MLSEPLQGAFDTDEKVVLELGFEAWVGVC